MTYILGFTGTRRGLTDAQLMLLSSVVEVPPDRVFHGGEIDGADLQFHDWLIKRGVNPRSIFVLPGDARQHAYWAERQRREYQANRSRETIGTFHLLATQPYLKRNRVIANECHRLLAAPGEYAMQLRSGTWATVRYARAAGKPVMLILPDGTVKEE